MRKVKATIMVAFAAMIMWVMCSLNEVYTHNEATLYGYHHEYSSWNVFTIIFDSQYMTANN